MDSIDSYAAEYQELKRAPPVSPLLGIFELDDETFYDATNEEKLSAVGMSGYETLLYETAFDDVTDQLDPNVKGTGITSSVRSLGGTIQPVIFLRERVSVDDAEGENEATLAELAAGIRIVVLLHELGHAEDIVRGVNFNHRDRKLDIIGAELYAHQFTCKHAKRRNYRLALEYYLDSLRDMLEVENEIVRRAAERFHTEVDVPKLRGFVDRV